MSWVGTRTYQFQSHVVDLWTLDNDVHSVVSEDLDVHPHRAKDNNRGVPLEGNPPGGEQWRDVEKVDHQGAKFRTWIVNGIIIGLVGLCLHDVMTQMNTLEMSDVVFHMLKVMWKLIGHGIAFSIVKSSTGRMSLVAEVARVEVLEGQVIYQDVQNQSMRTVVVHIDLVEVSMVEAVRL